MVVYFLVLLLPFEYPEKRVEIVVKAVHQNGYPLTKLVSRLGKSRKWIYNAFENAQIPLNHILQSGSILQKKLDCYDFLLP